MWGTQDVANVTVVDFLPLLVDLIETSVLSPVSSSNLLVLIRHVSAFAMSAASLPFSLSLNDSIFLLQRLAEITCPGIASLIESTMSVEALFPSRRTSLAGALGWVRVVEVALLRSDEDVTARKARKPISAPTFSEVEDHSPQMRSEGAKDVDRFKKPEDRRYACRWTRGSRRRYR